MAATVDRSPNQSLNLTLVSSLLLNSCYFTLTKESKCSARNVARLSPIEPELLVCPFWSTFCRLEVSKGCKSLFSFTLCALNLTPVRCNLSHDHRSEAVRSTVCYGQSFPIFFFFFLRNNSGKIKVCKPELEETKEGACWQKNKTTDRQPKW